MVAIKDMEMPSCCANCSFDVINKCLLLRKFIEGDCLVNGEDKRLDDCPLVEIEECKVGKWIRKPIRNEKGGCIGAEMICSYCKKDNEQDKKLAYCPNCGAEMRGAENV